VANDQHGESTEVSLAGNSERTTRENGQVVYFCVGNPQIEEERIYHFAGGILMLNSNNDNLQKQIQFYRTIVDLSHDGIVCVDNDGRIQVYNQAAARIIGVPVREAVGKLISQVNPTAGLPKVLVEHSVQHDELRKIGSRTAIVNRAPIYYEGSMIGAVSSVRDITELQQYEESIRRKLTEQGLSAKWSLKQIVAKARPMQRLVALAYRYAAVDSTLLLQGESGTGKEMVAQGIHMASPRKSGPFVALNCAAVPETLLESELFGYEDGAFTGARKGGKPGLFELAHHGTLFLDEIGELPTLLQARLLRALQEREVMRIGGNKVIPVDVRIIAATNRDLVQQIKQGLFRQDLYFRLAVLVLKVPPLRARTEDIPSLIDAFLKDWNQNGPVPDFRLTDEDISKLKAYNWPGNVRELRNLVERALVLAESGEPIHLFDPDVWIPIEWQLDNPRDPYTSGNQQSPDGLNKWNLEVNRTRHVEYEKRVNESEFEQITRVLREEQGQIGKAAERLGIHRTTLWRKIKAFTE
jgi:transcriptional regulator, propionate catabolism operon regulatory protein